MISTEVWEALVGWRDRPLDDQVKVLTGVVLDLLVEIEALRELHLSDAGDRERYAKAYEEAALLSHNSAGPSTGPMKVIGAYYPPQRDGERSWRETLMLRRFGMSAAEIRSFKAQAEEVEQYT